MEDVQLVQTDLPFEEIHLGFRSEWFRNKTLLRSGES